MDRIAALLAMPDEALVPVGHVRPLLQELRGGGDEGLGLTVEEVAGLCDRAPSTVRTWCAAGRLPGARRLRGREWRIPRRALAALLEGDQAALPQARGGQLESPPGGLGAWRREHLSGGGL